MHNHKQLINRAYEKCSGDRLNCVGNYDNGHRLDCVSAALRAQRPYSFFVFALHATRHSDCRSGSKPLRPPQLAAACLYTNSKELCTHAQKRPARGSVRHRQDDDDGFDDDDDRNGRNDDEDLNLHLDLDGNDDDDDDDDDDVDVVVGSCRGEGVFLLPFVVVVVVVAVVVIVVVV